MWGWLNYILRRLLGAALTVVAGAIVVFLVIEGRPGRSGRLRARRLRHAGRQSPTLSFASATSSTTRSWSSSGSGSGTSPAATSAPRSASTRTATSTVSSRIGCPTRYSIGSLALVIAVVVALIAGGAAALRRGRPLDVGITTASVVGISMPDFWLGYILVLIFALHLQWFPAYGFVSPVESVSSAFMTGFLPALAIAAPIAAGFSRILRVSLLETLQTRLRAHSTLLRGPPGLHLLAFRPSQRSHPLRHDDRAAGALPTRRRRPSSSVSSGSQALDR